jgi:hypothetical protein
MGNMGRLAVGRRDHIFSVSRDAVSRDAVSQGAADAAPKGLSAPPEPSTIRPLLAAALLGVARGARCDPTVAVYWTTDYAPAHEASLLSLPLSLASVKTHAAFAPRVVFAAETVETGAWASGAKEPTAPLACDELYVARAKIPNDRLSRLVAHAAARRQSLVDHAGADNLRFYVLPALERLRVRHAVYLDVDCFAVRSLRPLFDAVRTSRATLVVERATAAKSARPYANTTVARHLGYRPGADDFNAGVVGADVVEASKLDMPARLADLYEAHFREPLWGPNSVNQAATVLMAKAVATAFLDSGWNCKYDVAASADGCRVFHQKPSAYVWLAAASNETGRLLAACFGDAWRERVARVHPPRKHKGTT